MTEFRRTSTRSGLPIHVPTPRMDDQTRPVPGSPENALALYSELDRIQRHLRGGEQLEAMNTFAQRQAEHLNAVSGMQHEAHALVVTPAVRMGHLELGPLIFGSVLTLIVAAVLLLAMKLNVWSGVLMAAVFWLACTALLNAAIRGARANAVRSLVQAAATPAGEP